jgi:ABC-type Mn2+/Zn2+ transport system ATPase subunit
MVRLRPGHHLGRPWDIAASSQNRLPPENTLRVLTGLQPHYYAALAKVSRVARRATAPKLLDQLGLSKWGDTRIDKYSKGMMQRLGIAQALMNDPELIVLDEPTDGLDPVGRRDVRHAPGAAPRARPSFLTLICSASWDGL